MSHLFTHSPFLSLTLTHSVTLYLCCSSSFNVHRHRAHNAARGDECARQPKRPSKWKLYAKQFYISDEKFVFYTRMECWLWHNILIEMIHYTDRYGCMFAGCTGMWWKTTMSRISYVTWKSPGYETFVEIFHVFGRHFHWICMRIWIGMASPSKILDFRHAKLRLLQAVELMSNANEAYRLTVLLALALILSLSLSPTESWKRDCSIHPIRPSTTRSIGLECAAFQNTHTHQLKAYFSLSQLIVIADIQ